MSTIATTNDDTGAPRTRREARRVPSEPVVKLKERAGSRGGDSVVDPTGAARRRRSFRTDRQTPNSDGERARKVYQALAYVLFCIAILAMFDPFVFTRLASPQIIILGSVIAVALLEALVRRAEAVGVVSFWTYVVGAYGVIILAFVPADRSAAMLLYLLLPAAFVAGHAVARSPRRHVYFALIVVVGAINAGIAIVEKLLINSLFERISLLAATGTGKGIVASDHPLILGSMLAVTIALVPLSRLAFGWVYTLILAAGAWSTNAVGPTAIAALLVLAVLWPRLFDLVRRFWPIVAGVVLAVWVTLAVASLFIWKPEVPAMNLDDYSNDYRAAMYSMAPDILLAAPLGYGPGGPGRGVWMIDTALKGPKDLGVQVDSELMFLILDWGWIGVAAFFATFAVAVFAIRRSGYVGLALLAMSAGGFFLSIHAWGGPASFWIFILGASVFWPDVPRDPSQSWIPTPLNFIIRTRSAPRWRIAARQVEPPLLGRESL